MKKLKKLQSAEAAKPSSLAIHQEYQRLVSLEIKESFLYQNFASNFRNINKFNAFCFRRSKKVLLGIK